MNRRDAGGAPGGGRAIDITLAAFQIGVRALHTGDFRTAVAALSEAARAGHRDAWWLLAQAHLGLGDLRRGENYCRRAIHHGAGIEAWNLLAALRLHRDDYRGAEHASRVALGLQAGNRAAGTHLARALHGQRKAEEALGICRDIYEKDGDEPQVIRLMARVCRAAGLLDEARTVLGKGLLRYPADPWMLYDLTELDPCAPAHPRYIQARRALAEAGNDEQRATVHFTLARMFEHGGDAGRAFAAYRAGNACIERQLLQSGQAFDRYRHAASVDAVIARFDSAFFSTRADYGIVSGRPPVIIAGVSRSGKSLLAGLLAGHPRLVNLDECPGLGRLAARWGPAIVASSGATGRDAALMFARACTDLSTQAAGGADRLCLNTHPLNVRILGLLAVAVPGARVVCVERDERDLLIANYCTNHKNESFAYSCDLEDCRSYIRDYRRLMRHWQKVAPLAIHVVRYEDLVRDPDRVSGGVFEFLGLPWDEACRANRPDDPMMTLTPGVSLAGRSRLDPALAGYWRRYADQLPPEALSSGGFIEYGSDFRD